MVGEDDGRVPRVSAGAWGPRVSGQQTASERALQKASESWRERPAWQLEGREEV